MKKISLLLSTILIASSSFAGNLKPIAQKIADRKLQHASFSKAQVFQINNATSIVAAQLTDKVSNATVMEFLQPAVQRLLFEKPENLDFVIPGNSGSSIELELFKTNNFTPDFSVVSSGNNGQPVAYSGGVHYWGVIKGDDESIAAISIFDDEVMGMISSPSLGNMVLGRLEHDAQNRHILYNEHNLNTLPTTQCNTADSHTGYSNSELHRDASIASNCIRLYWEVNYDLYQNKGSVIATTNYVTGIYNQSAILYANDGIPVSLSQVFVWSTPSPYTATSTSSLLNQFQAYRTSFNGDLGILLGLAGGGGIAYVNGFCSSYNYGYTGVSTSYSNVPTYSWTVEVVTHEQGHLMGSSHTHACVWNGNNTAIDGCGPAAGYAYEGSCTGAPIPTNGGTIMSYCHLISAGINFSNGFGPQPKSIILSRYNSASCLTACSSTACNSPTGTSTTAVTSSSASFTWVAASGAVSYAIQYRAVGTSAWSTGTTSSTTFPVTGLTVATTYEWQVQTVCSGGSSAFTASVNFTTLNSSCNAPAGMITSSITDSTAIFSWTAVTGAINYSIRYRQSGTTAWITSTTALSIYNASGLTPGTSYEWQVLTNCSGGSSAFAASSVFTTTSASCNEPSGMTTSSITTSSATFSWTAVAGSSGYGIRYRQAGTSMWTTFTITGSLFNASGLTAGTSYEWQVQTLCSGGSSAFTVSVNFTTPSPACNAATGMATSNILSNAVTLTWTPVSGAASYVIRYRLTGTSAWSNVSTGTSSYTVTGLTASSTYEWKVQTVCSGGSSAYTALTTFTTTALPCSVPAGLNVTGMTASSAILNWNAVAGAISYHVQYRMSGSGSWMNANTGSTSFNATGLNAAATYEWQVQTVCSGGTSSFTSIASFTTNSPPCDVPSGITVMNITASSAVFNWTAVSGAISYNVQFRIAGTSGWSSANTVLTSYNAAGLNSGTSYEFEIQTICSFGSSSYSALTGFTTSTLPCDMPVGLATGNISSNSATLSWNQVPGAASYSLQWKAISNATWTTVSGISSTTYNLTGLTACSGYQFRVQTVCQGGASSFTASATFTTNGCSVVYCVSLSKNSAHEYIDQVSLGSINNSSGNNSGYGDFTGMTTILSSGTLNVLALTPGFQGPSNMEYWKVYIDYNHNGSFTDPGELAVSVNGTGMVNGAFSVPASALNGATRMRIQMQRKAAQDNPCAIYRYGEVEDYTVVVAGNSLSPLSTGFLPDALTGNLADVLLYPNPSRDHLSVKFTCSKRGNMQLNVYNTIGEKVTYLEQVVPEGSNVVDLNTIEFTSGIYIMEMEINGDVVRQKFSVSR